MRDASFDDLVGAQQNRRWQFNANCFSSLEVHDKLKSIRLLDRNISDFGSLENLRHVGSSLSMHRNQISAIRQESACLDVSFEDEHCGQPVRDRELCNFRAQRREMWTGQDEKHLRRSLRQGAKRRAEIVRWILQFE